MVVARPVSKVVKGTRLLEGAGVAICRTIGAGVRVDPFLMLDELKMPSEKATAGFPDHPHRGFCTCTIMLSGEMRHKDSMGNQGVIGPGGVQWMTAGRGIIHSEMPVVEPGKDLHGFQLWINLPSKDKMVKPRYQDLQASQIPESKENFASVRVLGGEYESKNGTKYNGPISLKHPGLLLDIRLEPDSEWSQHVSRNWNAFACVYEGSGKLDSEEALVQHAYIFGQGDTISAHSSGAGMRMLLFAAPPIGEPVVQVGPFVMNNEMEIRTAFADYRSGNFQKPSDNPWIDEL